jgi:hypothetical protein
MKDWAIHRVSDEGTHVVELFGRTPHLHLIDKDIFSKYIANAKKKQMFFYL